MKYYLKIFLLSVGIGILNVLIYVFLLQFQVARNSSYVPAELFTVLLILLSIPLQFIILTLVGFIFKRNHLATIITCFVTSAVFIGICFSLLWNTSTYERKVYKTEQIYNATEKYHYEQGISTPEGYPIKLLSTSTFTYSVEREHTPSELLKTNKIYSAQWGVGETTFIPSETKILLPDSLKLFWYSFLEDKYYKLNTKLDKNKISQYFKKGYKYDYSGKLDKILPADYDDLIVGIAPGGDVVLWISSAKNAKEMGIFKAQEINAKDLEYKDDVVKEEERKNVLKDTCTCENNTQFRKIVSNIKPIPFGVWVNKFRDTYNWKFSVNNFDQTKMKIDFSFFNGEEYSLYNEELSKINYRNEVLPHYLRVDFIKNKKPYKVFIEFNENELFHQFKILTQNNSTEPIEIALNINMDLLKATIKLQSKNRKINFQKMEQIKILND